MKKAISYFMKDPDIESEAKDLANLSLSDETLQDPSQPEIDSRPYRYVPLTMNGNSFQGTQETAKLLREVGGGDVIRHMVDLFYKKAFNDPHLDQFIASHNDPHHIRLGNWIVEKMGGEGKVWTQERATRSQKPVTLAGGYKHVVHDRSSAHAAAWHSHKRDPNLVGQHFNLQDSRVWMRLMFWSAREAGVFDASPSFADWYIRFIGHFVRVYERQAPAFARESARWSLSEENTNAYLANGCVMGPEVMGDDGMGLPVREALRQLPDEERGDSEWPYYVIGQDR